MVPITKVLFQTNKTMPDKYILEYINKMLTPEWKYEFYNDTDVINFFINNPISDMPYIIEKYNSFKNFSHKADLFRYYYLYINGGFFMDSDAMLYVDIETIVKTYNFICVESSCHPGTLFNGVLGASPNNKIIKKALYNAYNTSSDILNNYYHYFCKQLYDIVHDNDFKYNIKLYKERRYNIDYGDDIFEGETILFKHYWKNKVIPILTNKTYTWENSSITFLHDFQMDAFGKGYYQFVNKHTIIALFGNRQHMIHFNDDYTSFDSIRKDDSHHVNGSLVNNSTYNNDDNLI